ncbi:Sec1-like protein [Rickenella mellea]|uniref:Sec1-like protein n=1 Tax=Rickenella mellea TaxID=50990 RepID=A0A4Y7Q958_9AGAM|nr:Sec1-like protein [Rickenella mellea]
MASLITTLREKFLDAIRSVQPEGRWKALVVDKHSKQILGSVLKSNDILDEKVTVIDDISTYREAQPQLEAMYLLMPTTRNVERIIAEYSNGKQQYKKAHLFFIDGLAEQLFNRIINSPAEPFLACLTELYVNFWAIESQAFSIKSPSFFFSIFSPPRSPSASAVKAARDRLMEEMQFTSKCIANLCITLGEFPYVRYYAPTHHTPLGALTPHASALPPPPPEGSGRWRTNLARGAQAREYEAAEQEHVSKVLAFMVQGVLDEYKKANPDFPKPTEPPRPRGTLIITDRSMDMITPFVHEFTYQAMANDLLKIEDGTRYRYKFQSSQGEYEDMTSTLSDLDYVWTAVRHMHMRETIDKLMGDFNLFLQENAGFKGEGAASLNDMKDMLASLPQYQEQREKYSLHLNMAQECMDLFEQRKLTAVANIEQNCATGLTAEGKAPKQLVEEMVPLLDSREVTNKDKVRIIALYIQHRDGVPDEDRRRLYQHARLSMPEQDAVNGLVHMGCRISRGPGDKDRRKAIKHKHQSDEEYDLSRYKPLLQTVIDEQVAERLDQSVFPYVKDSPAKVQTSAHLRTATPPAGTTSLRSAKPSWHRAAKPGSNVNDVRQRLIVFVAGGMTYSEMRTAYQRSVALNKDVYIGSTHVITPESFMDDLKVVELGGVGSKVAPNGLRERGGGERPFQEFYDERYFTEEAPPPIRSTASPAPQQRRPAAARPQPSPAVSASDMSIQSSTSSKDAKKKKGRFGIF